MRAAEIVRGLLPFHKEKLRGLAWLILEKKAPDRPYIAAFSCLKGTYKKDKEILYTGACTDNMRGTFLN